MEKKGEQTKWDAYVILIVFNYNITSHTKNFKNEKGRD